MGDANQLLFVKGRLDRLRGPYLEVGAKDYGSTQKLRPLVGPDAEYVGVDLQPGPGVDLVLDLTAGFAEVDARLGARRFGTVFCLSVLEHCRQPFAMAENLTRLLAPGGAVCLSVPFAWKFHAYPGDYWRFTHEGVKLLFPSLRFDAEECVWATSRPGDLRPLDKALGKISFGSGGVRGRPRWLRAVPVRLFRFLARARVFGFLAGYRYVLAPTNVMMVGRAAET